MVKKWSKLHFWPYFRNFFYQNSRVNFRPICDLRSQWAQPGVRLEIKLSNSSCRASTAMKAHKYPNGSTRKTTDYLTKCHGCPSLNKLCSNCFLTFQTTTEASAERRRRREIQTLLSRKFEAVEERRGQGLCRQEGHGADSRGRKGGVLLLLALVLFTLLASSIYFLCFPGFWNYKECMNESSISRLMRSGFFFNPADPRGIT